MDLLLEDYARIAELNDRYADLPGDLPISPSWLSQSGSTWLRSSLWTPISISIGASDGSLSAACRSAELHQIEAGG